MYCNEIPKVDIYEIIEAVYSLIIKAYSNTSVLQLLTNMAKYVSALKQLTGINVSCFESTGA